MYQSSNFRRTQPSQDAPLEKYRVKAQQLQELFPTWSNDDLRSLLSEVNGDVDLAATRISEGRAEQWGSVTRKRDKKSTPTSQSQTKEASAPRERGEFRGSRGGRGGRGGPGRGGAARGSFARAVHHETNGHRPKPSQGGDATGWKRTEEASATPGVATPTTPTNASQKLVEDASHEWSAPASNGIGTWDTNPSESTSGWATSTPPVWDTAVNGSASPAVPAQAPAPIKPVKTPATSKLSWAQIARPQEKPTAPPQVPAPAPAPVTTPAPPVTLESPREPTPPHEEPPSEPPQQGWEEPTTVQPPTWDDEPQIQLAADSWAAETKSLVPDEPKPEVKVELPQEPAVTHEIVPSALPAQVQQSSPETEVAPAPMTKPLTPAAHTRPSAASHRSSAKFKTTDQPVVMPSSNFGTGIEKVGMQFGSLSLGGEDLDADTHEPAPEQTPVRAQELSVPETHPQQQPAQSPPAPVQESPSTPVTSPPSQPPVSAVPTLFQQAIPQQAQQQPPVQPVSQPQHSLPSSLSQSTISSQSSLQSTPATSSISPYSHQSQALPQQSLSNHQLPQNQPQIHSQQHQYVQHGLPTHLDPAQSHVQHPPSLPHASQQQNITSPSYFRQPEAPYFHTPTPPAGQAQESPYGTFGQLGQQLQHQGQGSHLGSFGGGEYGYGENQRNFYDSYSGPTGFGNRNVLSHDEIKGLPGAQQQPHAAPGLPPSNSQPSQQLPPSSQAGSQTQPSAGQGPQQSYPPPLPYYYPYPQNQYYGSPYNSGYTVPQPFVKYPAVFQTGPPGPQSAPSPAAKQGPSAVQPQSPYGQSLYGQQHPSSAYDDIGYQHHTQHSHGQSVGSGLPSNDYGKHQSLYGASGQGMQGFMGLGQTTGPSSGPPIGQRTQGGSPEAVYKPYGGNVGVKDVGTGVGVGVGQGGVGQGPQTRGGVQQPTQGGFYGAQRFAGSASAIPQSQQTQQHQPQGQGPQGHIGYPQGGSDASTFYSYQPRQQQGYWQ